jgi:hypothetical protein
MAGRSLPTLLLRVLVVARHAAVAVDGDLYWGPHGLAAQPYGTGDDPAAIDVTAAHEGPPPPPPPPPTPDAGVRAGGGAPGALWVEAREGARYTLLSWRVLLSVGCLVLASRRLRAKRRTALDIARGSAIGTTVGLLLVHGANGSWSAPGCVLAIEGAPPSSADVPWLCGAMAATPAIVLGVAALRRLRRSAAAAGATRSKHHGRDIEYGRTTTAAAARLTEADQAGSGNWSRLEALAVALATGVGIGRCLLPGLALRYPPAAAVSSDGSAGWVLSLALASSAGVGTTMLLCAVLLSLVRRYVLPASEPEALVAVLTVGAAMLQCLALMWSSQPC